MESESLMRSDAESDGTSRTGTNPVGETDFTYRGEWWLRLEKEDRFTSLRFTIFFVYGILK